MAGGSIALSNAVLWASIHVPIPNDVNLNARRRRYTASPSKQYELAITTAHRRAEAINEWFNRSGVCVLSVSLHAQQRETSAVIYDIILDALIPFCRRWGALKCDAPTSKLMRIADIPASDLPQLHTLSINGGTFENYVPPTDDPQRTVRGWMASGVVRAPPPARDFIQQYDGELRTLSPMLRPAHIHYNQWGCVVQCL